MCTYVCMCATGEPETWAVLAGEPRRPAAAEEMDGRGHVLQEVRAIVPLVITIHIHMYIYIYIYMCVCVGVWVGAGVYRHVLTHRFRSHVESNNWGKNLQA